MKPLFCSFYTQNTPYEQEKNFLLQDLIHHNLEYVITGVDSKGSWVLNTNQKSIVCLNTFDTYNRPIVYLDCDARVRQYPKLFETLTCDVAVHYRRGRELLSGTLFFNQTTGARTVLEAWVQKCKDLPHIWDQKNLATVLLDMKDVIDIGFLPASYVQIFDLMKDAGEPVIEHMQASRRYKKLV